MKRDRNKKMAGRWKLFSSAVAASGLFAASNCAQAQYYHRHHHHHHHVGAGYGAPIARDGAGHLIDARGHHVDQYGRHTGGIGVYANGGYASPVYGTPQLYPGQAVYPNTSTWNPGVASSNVMAIPSNSIPPNVVPGSPMGVIGKISISNPTDSGGSVNYVLNGSSYSIQPGQTQSLDNDRVWTIDFASGGPRGNVRYTLSPGQFKFVVKESGWELVRAANLSANTGAIPQGQIPPAPLPALDAGQTGPAPFNPPPQ